MCTVHSWLPPTNGTLTLVDGRFQKTYSSASLGSASGDSRASSAQPTALHTPRSKHFLFVCAHAPILKHGPRGLICGKRIWLWRCPCERFVDFVGCCLRLCEICGVCGDVASDCVIFALYEGSVLIDIFGY